MTEVRSINALRASRDNDNSLLSPIECLEDVIQDIKSGKLSCDKLLVLTLDTGPDGGGYDTHFAACNMKMSEMIALMEVEKHIFYRCMGV